MSSAHGSGIHLGGIKNVQFSRDWYQADRSQIDAQTFINNFDWMKYTQPGTDPYGTGGGMYYFRLTASGGRDSARLLLERVIPDYGALALPDFSGADSTVLADGIGSVRFGYFGRDPGSADSVAPTWRDRWDDPQRLPDLIRVDVTPVTGASWPTLVVEPRIAPEAGCVTWNPSQRRCG